MSGASVSHAAPAGFLQFQRPVLTTTEILINSHFHHVVDVKVEAFDSTSSKQPKRMSKMRLARPSSALHRPMSADVHMNIGASRASAPFTVYNPKGSAKLPARPHSSCEPGRERKVWDNREAHYDSLSLSALDDIENILEENPSKTSVRTMRRRYLCNSLGGIDCSNPDSPKIVPGPVMSHFDIKVKTDETKVDHLRMYYCDYFQSSMPDPIITKDEKTVEVDKMCNWLLSVSPRTRFDAYPLWVLTNDMLRRFLSKEICLVDNEAKAKELKIQSMAATMLKQEQMLKNSELTLTAARAEAQHAAEISQDLDIWKAKAETLEKECEKLQATIDHLSKQINHQEQIFEKRMDAKILDVKAKVESIWEKQIESMRMQAEKAKAEAEAEKERLSQSQEQTSILQKELELLKATVEEKARTEQQEYATLLSTKGLDIKSLEKNKGVLSSSNADELLTYLEDLLQNVNIKSQIVLSAELQDSSNMRIISVLQQGRKHGCSAEYLHSNLSHSEQWDLFRNLVRGRSVESGDGKVANEISKELPLLPILLHLAVRYCPDYSNLATLLLPSSGTRGFTADYDAHDASSFTRSDSGATQMTAYSSIGNFPEDERLGQVMVLLEQKKTENESLRHQIDALLKRLEELSESDPTNLQSLGRGEFKRTGSMQQSFKSGPTKIPSGEGMASNIVKFRPICLRVYSIDDRVLKGKIAKPLPVATLLSLIATAYEAKARADAIDDRKGNKRQHFPEFLRDFFLNKYGVRSLSFLNFKSFVMGIQQNLAMSQEKFLENLRKQPKISDVVDLTELQMRMKIFGIVAGIHPVENWNDRLSDFVLGALSKLFSTDSLKESLEPKDQRGKLCVDLILAVDASKEAWFKHGFDQGACNVLESKIVALAQKESGNLLLYDWMLCLTQEWLNASSVIDSQLRQLFAIHDADGNGTMDLEEFQSVLRDTTPEVDESDMLRLFAEALAETAALGESNADPDSIHPQAFSYVARRFQLLPRKLSE